MWDNCGMKILKSVLTTKSDDSALLADVDQACLKIKKIIKLACKIITYAKKNHKHPRQVPIATRAATVIRTIAQDLTAIRITNVMC